MRVGMRWFGTDTVEWPRSAPPETAHRFGFEPPAAEAPPRRVAPHGWPDTSFSGTLRDLGEVDPEPVADVGRRGFRAMTASNHPLAGRGIPARVSTTGSGAPSPAASAACPSTRRTSGRWSETPVSRSCVGSASRIRPAARRRWRRGGSRTTGRRRAVSGRRRSPNGADPRRRRPSGPRVRPVHPSRRPGPDPRHGDGPGLGTAVRGAGFGCVPGEGGAGVPAVRDTTMPDHSGIRDSTEGLAGPGGGGVGAPRPAERAFAVCDRGGDIWDMFEAQARDPEAAGPLVRSRPSKRRRAVADGKAVDLREHAATLPVTVAPVPETSTPPGGRPPLHQPPVRGGANPTERGRRPLRRYGAG